MCALCGAFGVAEHWSDRPESEAGGRSRSAERRGRAAAASRVLGLYGLKLAEWNGRFLLSNRTGRTALVEHFGALWPAAERLTGRVCDPLDPEIIAALEGATGR